MKEKKLRILKITIAGIVIAVVLSAVAVITMSFRVTAIAYDGNTHYTDEELTNYIFGEKEYVNALVYFFVKDRQDKAVIPFVQDYEVEVVWPNQLKVMIYEKDIIGYISYMGCNMYFDKDGIVVDSSQEVLGDVPEVCGINYKNIILHQSLETENDKIFTIMLNLIQLLDKYEIKISKVSFDTLLNVTIYIDDIKVLLGDEKELTEKVHELSMLQPKLEGLSGTLYLNSFGEDTKAVIFKKNDKIQ